MKFLLLLLSVVALSSAFTVSSYTGRRSTAVYTFGSKIKNLIGRNDEESVAAAAEQEENVEEVAVPEEVAADENQLNLMSKIKEAGAAGAVSLFLWELAFWAISIPVAIVAFVQIAGSWPDLTDKEDLAKVGTEAFAFANVARFALPVRIGLAVSTTPWVKDNIVDAPWAASIFKKDGEEQQEP
jgi:hypothetical protein